MTLKYNPATNVPMTLPVQSLLKYISNWKVVSLTAVAILADEMNAKKVPGSL